MVFLSGSFCHCCCIKHTAWNHWCIYCRGPVGDGCENSFILCNYNDISFNNLSGYPVFSRSLKRLLLLTRSNCLFRSMKATAKGCSCFCHFSCSCLCVTVVSTIHLCALKPHCNSRWACSVSCQSLQSYLDKIALDFFFQDCLNAICFNLVLFCPSSHLFGFAVFLLFRSTVVRLSGCCDVLL